MRRRKPPRRGRWSRRRGVTGLFATVAALGLAGAYIGPAGFAMAQTDAQETDTSTTVYSGMVADAQSMTVVADAQDDIDLGRGTYSAVEIPKVVTTTTTSSSSSSSGSGESVASVLYYTGGGTASEWMASAGIAESDWGYVDYIVSRESGWNPNATNSSSGACGLAQALPCSKVPGNGYDPVDNLTWATSYAVSRYGSWSGAYTFWVNNHWW